MVRVLLLFLFWVSAPLSAWAQSDDFCGPGVHRHTLACHCQPTGNLCFCREPGEIPSLKSVLRETLPVVVAALWVDLPAPSRAPWSQRQPIEPLAPQNWTPEPSSRPPRP